MKQLFLALADRYSKINLRSVEYNEKCNMHGQCYALVVDGYSVISYYTKTNRWTYWLEYPTNLQPIITSSPIIASITLDIYDPDFIDQIDKLFNVSYTTLHGDRNGFNYRGTLSSTCQKTQPQL